MNDRLRLLGYFALVVLVTFVHAPLWLAAGLVIAVAASGKGRWRLLRRTLLSVAAFNLTVSLGYVLLAHWRGELRTEYLLLVNLRVVLLVYLGFWTVSRINLPRALGFSPTLAFLATLAAGQIQGFRKVLSDFQFAFRSRSPVSPGVMARTRFAGRQGQNLLDKSVHTATEIGQAMRSRGCFEDD